MTWDAIIVGGGSAGCVLASRLSENPGLRVLLIEAGRDVKPGQEGSALLDMYPGRAAFDPANHWPALTARFQPVSHNDPTREPPRRYEQARILGGGSSINGQVANRGTPDDWDEWAALGATGWSWADVLPWFRRIERDLDFTGPLHGTDGPIPIHRIPRPQWPGFSHAVAAALTDAGFPDIRDGNGNFADGWFPITLSNDGTHRVSTTRAYLGAAVRARPNLRILTDRQVLALDLVDRKAQGVTLEDGERIPARRVILSAGAIHSPALLLRAGIGPAPTLRALGIDVIANLGGVGSNLQEHPGISLSALLAPAARLRGTTRRHIHLALRYSSALPGTDPADMYMMAAAKSAWHPLGERIASLLTWINKPFSRGNVTLVAADPRQEPVASFNHLADARDAARLVDAVRRMAALFAHPRLAAATIATGPASYSGFAKSLGRQTIRNWLLTAPTALALDALPPLRAPFFRRFVTGNRSIANDDAIESYVRSSVFGQWHPAGTCRLGPAQDPAAVLDPTTSEVHGIRGLHVVDGSVMPSIPRANLNLPIIMLAEKLAAAIGAELAK